MSAPDPQIPAPAGIANSARDPDLTNAVAHHREFALRVAQEMSKAYEFALESDPGLRFASAFASLTWPADPVEQPT